MRARPVHPGPAASCSRYICAGRARARARGRGGLAPLHSALHLELRKRVHGGLRAVKLARRHALPSRCAGGYCGAANFARVRRQLLFFGRVQLQRSLRRRKCALRRSLCLGLARELLLGFAAQLLRLHAAHSVRDMRAAGVQHGESIQRAHESRQLLASFFASLSPTSRFSA